MVSKHFFNLHLEFFTIEIKIESTGERIPLELTFFTSDNESDRKRMTDKIKTQMEKAANGEAFSVSYYVSERYNFEEGLYQ